MKAPKGYWHCRKCKTNLIPASRGKRICGSCRIPKAEIPIEIDCRYRPNIDCDQSTPCERCGFYPPVEEERKRRLNE